MTWINEWDASSRLCESWWVRCWIRTSCSRNVCKIIKGVILEAMMLPNQSWCSISFVPHYSFHLALLCAHLSLSSHFPVTNIASFRTKKQLWKDVPTRVVSNTLLGQAVITHLEGWGQSLAMIDLVHELDSCVIHSAGVSWSIPNAKSHSLTSTLSLLGLLHWPLSRL